MSDHAERQRQRPVEAGSGAGEREDPETVYTIGRLVELLKDEFPDLSISKIRYLEDRGLVSPERTSGGYRTYTAADLRRLRTVLLLQRDEFLPLDVIKERLERGTASTAAGRLATGTSLEKNGILRRRESEHTWREVMAETGADEAFLNRLAEFRLIEGSPRGMDGMVSESDMEIIRICAGLSRFGVEPRNLRLLKSSAEREAALLEQAVTTLLRSSHEERREQGEKNLQELGVLTARLLDLLLCRELRRLVS